MQFALAFSVPPTNHFANGGFDQSSALVHFADQSSCAACSPQNFSGSDAAAAYRRSYSAIERMCAVSEKCFGGGKISCCAIGLERKAKYRAAILNLRQRLRRNRVRSPQPPRVQR